MQTKFDPNKIFPNTEPWIELEISQHQRLIQSLPNWLEILEETYGGKIFGGYLEKRAILFDQRHVSTKTIHLGLDFWLPERTNVLSPITGQIILSEADNKEPGGWGGRIDIKTSDGIIHTFGHLQDPTLKIGEEVTAGQVIGKLGSREENGGWKPHLHYQCAAPHEYDSFQPAYLMDAYAQNFPDLHARYPAPL